jgi:hypothetical protein
VVGKYPLRLAFRAREGDVVGFRAGKGGDVAPSRISSERGGDVVGEYLLRLAF